MFGMKILWEVVYNLSLITKKKYNIIKSKILPINISFVIYEEHIDENQIKIEAIYRFADCNTGEYEIFEKLLSSESSFLNNL